MDLAKYYTQICKAEMLNKEQEAALFKEYKTSTTTRVRKEQIRDQVIRANLRFAFKEAKKFSKNDPLLFEELICAANDGLLVGFEKYDPDTGYRFLSYAGWWVQQRILKEMSKMRLVSLPIWKQQLATKISRLREKNPDWSVEDVIAALPDVPEKDIRELFDTQYLTYYIDDMDENDFEGQMSVHFYGLLNSVEAVPPIFKSQGFGHIANICSIGGRIPLPHLAPYCASKFAMAGLSQTLSTELWKDGIKVTTIYPGLMRTGSAIQAVFKGETEKEFAWFALASSLPGLSLDADVAAKRILEGLQEGRTEIRLSWSTKWAFGLQQFFPESLRALLAGVGALLPRGQSPERRTGAQSQTWLKKQVWGEPIIKIQEEAQKRFNERPREDAAFNLNLEQSPR